MQEIIIEQLDGVTIRRRVEDWDVFKKPDLQNLKTILEAELEKVNNLLVEFK